MPELPEVETVRKSLEPKLTGEVIISCILSEAVKSSHAKGKKTLLKKQTAQEFEPFFEQAVVTSVERRSKYLLLWLKQSGSCYCLLSHLGMTGAWFVVSDISEIEAKYQKHIHATFRLGNGKLLVYSDIRRFGELRLLTEEEYQQFEPIQSLGPEPFDNDAYAIFLNNVQTEKNQKKPVKGLLMNQRIIAGVGNIYACEALFHAKIHPERKAGDVTEEEWSLLFRHVHDLMAYSISVGGASISDYVDAEGNRGTFQEIMCVYQQKACRDCKNAVEKVEIEKRSSFFCPNCQS